MEGQQGNLNRNQNAGQNPNVLPAQDDKLVFEDVGMRQVGNARFRQNLQMSVTPAPIDPIIELANRLPRRNIQINNIAHHLQGNLDVDGNVTIDLHNRPGIQVNRVDDWLRQLNQPQEQEQEGGQERQRMDAEVGSTSSSEAHVVPNYMDEDL